MSRELYGRLQILAAMKPNIMRHVEELRRMIQFVNAPPLPSPLPPVASLWDSLRAAYVPPVVQPKTKVKRARPPSLTDEQLRARQEATDFKIAVQMSKQMGYVSGSPWVTSGSDRRKRGRSQSSTEASNE